MKKRLLSALLALAMVLTLLPMSAFAVDDDGSDTSATATPPATTETPTTTPETASEPTPTTSETIPATTTPTNTTAQPSRSGSVQPPNKATVVYKEKNEPDNGNGGINEGPGWYYDSKEKGATLSIWNKVKTGCIVGSTYYSSGSDIPETNSNIIVIGNNVSIRTKNTSLTLDLQGHDSTAATVTSITCTAANNGQINSLTIKNTRNPNNPGSVDVYSLYYLTSLTAENASITGVNMVRNVTRAGASETSALTHRVQLTNCTVGGAITLGASYTNPTTKAVTYASQNVQLKNCTIGGQISVVGDNSTIKLEDVECTSGIQYTGAGSANAIDISGQKGNGIGDIVVGPETVAARSNQGIPGVKISGGRAGNIRVANGDKRTGIWTVNIEQQAMVGNIDSQTNNTGTNRTQANITVNKGHTGDIRMFSGTLNLTGPNATTGVIDLDGEVTMNVTGGTVKTGNIDANGNATTKLNIPADNTNTFGEVSNYAGATIKGGSFTTAVPTAALVRSGSEALVYELYKDSDPTIYKYTYYRMEQLGDALSAQNNGARNILKMVGQIEIPPTTYFVDVVFKDSQLNGKQEWGTLKAVAGSTIQLPEKFGSQPVNGWFDGVLTRLPKAEYLVPSSGTDEAGNALVNKVYLDAKGSASSGLATSLTKVGVAGTVNTNVTVKLVGNTITVSGAVDVTTNGLAKINIRLYLDAVQVVTDDNGNPKEENVVLPIELVYNETNGKLNFANDLRNLVSKYGITLDATFDTIVMSNGTTKYTLDGSGIRVRPSLLAVDSSGALSPADYSYIETSINVPTLRTDGDKNALKDALTNKTNTKFDWYGDNNQAILQAVNAVQASITNNDVQNWIKTAQQQAWNAKNSGKYDTTRGSSTGYGVAPNNLAYLVPYLQLNITDYNKDGMLTGTMVPSYHVEIRTNQAGYLDAFSKNGCRSGTYYAKSGALSLDRDNEAGSAGLTINPTGLFPGDAAGTIYYLHQDGKYVYRIGVGNTFTITHLGESNGLGSFVINKVAPLVTLYDDEATKINTTAKIVGTYDTLQAAVDDAKDGYTVKVDAAYKGSTAISVTGDARVFEIVAYGDNAVSSLSGTDLVSLNLTSDTNTGGTVENSNHAKTYKVQLLRKNTVAQPEETKGIPISVSVTTGGTASVSKTRANEGDIITITLTPVSGYAASGVTVRSTDGTNITSVPVSGSGTRYTFTVPKGSTGITVIPSFTRTATTASGATVAVVGVANGSASTSAGENKIPGGTNVSVTVSPNNGYRTMGLNLTSNAGNPTATRIGKDNFLFTVPANATSVVVTPRFDVDNGTVFEDVWSTDYYSSPVAWAVRQGVTDGTSTYIFSPDNPCTRAQMVTFLWRAAGRPAVSGVTNPFWDVQPGTYYYDAVMWAVSKGITNGVTDNRFGTDEQVTRAQAVTFLWRYAGKPAASTSSGFYDVPTNVFYTQAVTWAVSKGITNGDGSTVRFNPNGFCARAQIVTFLYRNATGARA